MSELEISTRTNAPESVREQVILANKEFYRHIAGKYDHYEYCASDAFFQKSIEEDLETIQNRLPRRSCPIRCLDCGGGTGNVTLKMLRRGWRVTVVDVSLDMLEILKAKVNSAGETAIFINDSVENFFASRSAKFDIISFSSVLHHLYSPLSVVTRAADCISMGGFFYSIFDPVPPSSQFAATCFDAFDTFLAKILYDRQDLFPGLKRRLRKLRTAQDPTHGRAVVSVGDLAEYHARRGIDDKLIQGELSQLGFRLNCRCYPVGRTPLMRYVNGYLRVLLNFSILAQRLDAT